MKRGTLIAAVVLAIGAFACERKHDDDKAGDTTTTSGTYHEEQYTGSPGITGGGTTGADTTDRAGAGTGLNSATGSSPGVSTGTDRNASPNNNAGTMGSGSGARTSALSEDQSGISADRKDGGVAADFGGKDGGHVNDSTTGSGTSKGKIDPNNKSTTLGDGTSGQYTGGKGTYGGKATQGTGEKK